MIVRLSVSNLGRENAQRLEDIAAGVAGVTSTDTWIGRAEIGVAEAAIAPNLAAALASAGFAIETEELLDNDGRTISKKEAKPVRYVHIDGMTCRSCELTIERKFKKIGSVADVRVDASAGVARIVCRNGCEPRLEELRQAVKDHGYAVRGFGEAERPGMFARPSLWRLAGLFALVLLLGSLLSKLGLFKSQYEVGSSITVTAALILGLVAGSSSCIAVSGGLLLSSAAKFNERYAARGPLARMRPVFHFIAGRAVSYGLFGGLIGAFGKAFTPSPLLTGGLIVAAAAYMLVMGLDMLKIAPAWLKKLTPRLPKGLAHRIMDAEGKEHPATPFLLGAGTFFLPCGFTQSLQLYALTTGSFTASALILGAFALGTGPALAALGWASGSLKGNLGKLFFQFSGALVVVLGLWNLQNGFTVAGYPLALPKFEIGAAKAAGAKAVPSGQKQVIKMDVGGDNAAYDPDVFTVKAGVPVRWEINGVDVGGCISYLQSRKLGIGLQLRKGLNVVEFTPKNPGTYSFSCSMGMFRGTINVTP